MSVTILVVEDEPLIRLGLAGMLEDAGFTTVEAADADQAIAILEADSRIRIVVTDVDMPGSMDGIKLAHYIRKQWPPIKLIVISGKVGLSDADLPANTPYFSKPYPDERLLDAVRTFATSANEP